MRCGKRRLEDRAFLFAHQFAEIHRMAGEIRIGRGQNVGTLIVHPQAVDLGQELVAHGAVDGPVALSGAHRSPKSFRCRFGRRAACARSRSKYCSGSRKPSGWSTRTPSISPLAIICLDARMGRRGHLRPLRTNAYQRVDVEKSPIVGQLAGQLPAVQQVELPAAISRRTRLIALHAGNGVLQAPGLSRRGEDICAPAPHGVDRRIGLPLRGPRHCAGGRVHRSSAPAPGQQLSPRCRRERPGIVIVLDARFVPA